MQELFLVLGQKSAELMPPLRPEPKKVRGTVKPPYNDMGYITISSILQSTPLIIPFLV